MATLLWRQDAGTSRPPEAAAARSYSLCRLLRPAFGVLGGLFLLALLWPILAAGAAPTGLFFSEYIAGPDAYAALEIFNGAGAPIDLAQDGYQVQFFFDGASEASVTVDLTGLLGPGETFVLVPHTAAPPLLAAADQICEQPFFDGNDAVVLRQRETIVDALGQIGFNPGEAWGSEPVTTRGVILRRKAVVTTGDANSSDPFEPALEWEAWPLVELAGLNAHALAPSPPAPPAETVTPAPLPADTPLPGITASLLITASTPVSPPVDPIPPAAVPTPALPVLIGEFLYAGLIPSTEGDEFVELCNPNTETVDLTGYKIGDEAARGGGESMYQLLAGTKLAPDKCLLVAKNAEQFYARFGFLPDFQLVTGSGDYRDNPTVLNLSRYTAWAGGAWALANGGDELLVLGPEDEVIDSVAYGNADYASLGLAPGATARAPYSLQRLWPVDTNSMAHDFVRALPSPGSLTVLPTPPPAAPEPAVLPDGMQAFWGHLYAHSSYTDGAGPPFYALAMARAAGLHFYAITDPGALLDTPEWLATLNQTQQATVPGAFVGLRGVEWRHDAAGHITVFNSTTQLSATDPVMDTLPELYAYLAADPAALAQFNHPGRADFDHFTFDPAASSRLALQEISRDVAGEYTRFEAAFLTSNQQGWRVAPTASSDALAADWGLATSVRTGLVAPALTEQELVNAIQARRLFATEDANLALTLRIAGVWMGAVLTRTGTVPVVVDMVDPDPEPATLFFYQGSRLLATVPLTSSSGQWTSTVTAWPGQFFWLKLVQADGQVAYSAPIWVEGQAPPDVVYLNELLPAPRNRDWNGDGLADSQDEWIELYNSTDHPVDLNGWQLSDLAGTFNFPPGIAIPAGGFAVFYRSQTGLALNNARDTITLTNPIATPVDSFSYGASPGYNGSWCRLPDGSSGWSDRCEPSPGVSNREKAPSGGPLTANIYEAKRFTPGALVRIKGRVTAPPGILGARYMYIQDSSAGILIYLPQDHRLYFNLGDRVQVEGNLRLFHGEFEIAVKERNKVSFMEPGLPPPPLPIATTSLLEPYEGLLVMLSGQAVRFSGRANLWLNDGTGEAKVYIKDTTGISRPWLAPNTPATIVGIVSQYSEGEPSRTDYRLLPRYQSDLVVTPSPLPAPGWPTTLPETGAAPGW